MKQYQKIALAFTILCSLFALLYLFVNYEIVNQNELQTIKKHQQRKQFDRFFKPQTDPNDYEIMITKNGIKTLIVSQTSPMYFGACLSINGVGNYQDFPDNLGLSHFLEHLVFTGSKNYTEPLDTFIIEKGGLMNGMTGFNFTQYPFDVKDEQLLEDVLKRLVDFIVYPGFFKEQVEKEIYAVTSEYYIDMIDSTSKIFYLWKLLADKDSQFSKFDIGTTETLAQAIKNPKGTLQKYLDTYYVPQNMYLVVTTSKELKNQTKQHIDEIFSIIPEKPSPKFKKVTNSFNSQNKGLFVKIRDDSKIAELTISFCLPKFNSDLTKSLDFIVQVLTNVGEKQFCSQITNKKLLATECEIFSVEITEKESMFGFVLALTKKGKGNLQKIIKTFFSFVDEIKREAVKKEVYKMIAKEQQINFKFQEQQHPFEQLIMLSEQFSKTPNQSFQYESYNYSQFDEKEINKILEEIHPRNAMFILRSNNFSSFKIHHVSDNLKQFINKNESYKSYILYNLNYSTYKLSETEQSQLIGHQIKNLQIQKSLKTMEFIFSKFNFDLIKPLNIPKRNKPTLLKSNVKGNLWFYHDSSFKEPIDAGLILLDHPYASQSARNQLYLRILSAHVNIKLQNDYSAHTNRGLCLYLFFFSGMPFEIIFKNIYETFQHIKPKHFQEDSYKQFLLEKIRNELLYERETGPLHEAIQILLSVMSSSYYTNKDLMQQLNHFSDTDWKDFVLWLQRYQSQLHLEVLIGGNIESQTAEKIYEDILSYVDFVPIPRTEYSQWYIRSLTANSLTTSKKNSNQTIAIRQFHREYDQFNIAVINFYELGFLNDKEKRIVEIITPLVNGEAFQYLRSELQLGYVSEAFFVNLENLHGLVVLIEGYRKNVVEVDKAIEQYLKVVENHINNLPSNLTGLSKPMKCGCTDKGNQTHFCSKNKHKTHPRQFYSLSNEISSFWDEILTEDYFKNQKQQQKHINITKQDVLDQYKKWFSNQKSKLSIQLENPFKQQDLNQTSLNSNETYCQVQEKIFNSRKEFLKTSELYQKVYINKVPLLKKN